MSLSDDDLMLVNAYHDGELDRATAAHVRARLKAEPELRAALDGVEEVSAALGGLRPARAAAPSPQPRRPGWRPLALAASLALAVGLGALGLGERDAAPVTPLDWHRHFAAQDYAVGRLAAATRWMGQGPDLASADLTLVDVSRQDGGAVFLHYAGLNGCRLTFGTHDAAPERAAVPGLLTDGWSIGQLHYTLLAAGMDADRFAAIARLLRDETRTDRPEDQLLAEVRDATRRAEPCA